MIVNNILIVSPLFQDYQRIMENVGINKSVRFLPEEEMSGEDLDWADALVCFHLKSNPDYSKVKWVHSLGAGVDGFLYRKKWDEKVLLTRTVCSFGQRIAEYCLSYILKDLQLHDRFQQSKLDQNWISLTPKLLNEQKVMVYGTGEIGQAVAKIFSGFGVEVYGVSQSGTAKEHFKEVYPLESHYSRLTQMNYLINTLPLTEKTEGLFGGGIFQKLMGAGFINVGRGASLDEKALLTALNFNQVRFAVLDVFEQEPLPEDHSFWQHPSVMVTPHISAKTTPDEGVNCFLETLKNIEENRPLANKVNVKNGY